ncbi:MAG: Nif3-like dinuclear metal center hexameric protein [Planctomycetaceae bacterium]
MHHLPEIIEYLSRLAPLSLAEEWDNVGLLVGDRQQPVAKVMTCLTLTADVAREAIENDVQLIVSHHPVLFRPVQRVTSETPEGRLLLQIMAARIAVYSPHTGYDSALRGINQQLAERLELQEIAPLRPIETTCGGGRCGMLPRELTLRELLDCVKQRLGIASLQFTGDEHRLIHKVAVACGSAAEFIPDAVQNGCQALLLGEARFHSLLEAESAGLSLILAGHYATERPAMELLAMLLGEAFAGLTVWASRRECDPLRWA